MRMGIHANTAHHRELVEHYYRVLRPPIFKTMDPDPALLEAVKRASPGTKTIFRNYWPDQNFDTHRHFREETLHRVMPVRHLVDFVEGYNEYGVKRDPRGAARFAKHEIAFAEEQLSHGLGAAIGGFSTGFADADIDVSVYDAIRPMFEFCHKHGGDDPRVIWHSHEYAGPYMMLNAETPDGKNQHPEGGSWQGVSPDPSAYWDPQLEGWLTLRYRKLWKLLERDGYIDVRMAFTETGIDDTPPRPGPANTRGWRDYNGTEWSRLPGVGDFADQMRWYAWQLSHDHYVLGFCDFGWGDDTGDWGSFDLSRDREMFDRMIAEQSKVPEGYSGEEPVTDTLDTLLSQEFGDRYDNLRDSLASNPNGPNGPFNTQDPDRFEGIAIHHSASSRNTTWHRVSDWHVNRQFAGIGYHLGIRQGRVAYLGDINTARAHVAGQNHRYVGVCVMGNYEDAPGDEPSGGDVALLHRLVGVLDAYLGLELPVVGHYQVPGSSTACPGDRLKPIVATLRDTITPFPVQGIKDAADAAQAIEPNPTASLYNAIRGDGFWPISDEFTFEGYQCQLARKWQGESERIYFCLIPIWDQVGWINRR